MESPGDIHHNTASGSVTLTSEGANQYIMADAIGWDSDGVFTDDWNCDGIPDPEVLIDDPDATYTGTWTNATNNSYGTYRRDSTAAGDSVTWTPKYTFKRYLFCLCLVARKYGPCNGCAIYDNV